MFVVDLQKAFESAWKIGLLYKPVKTGILKRCFSFIKEQYNAFEIVFLR